ncbi:DUF402 domain-containing protein [Nonomuraea sp. NPDC050202]|uniref:DUF402 domain-containing protein n=1 Tax=Nonomuraea sp. NPDC050202 TaxID=3155035 RepID=UPI0033CB4693
MTQSSGSQDGGTAARRGRRPVRPGPDSGPVALLARRLWELKKQAGDPSFADMASRLGAARLAPGSTAVRRHVWRGRVWTAVPYRVLQDTEDYLVVAGWPGLRGLVSTTLIDTITNGGHDRDRPIRELASGTWELGWWAWRRTSVRSWYGLDAYFTIRQFFDAEHRPLCWYVDFDLPKQRTPLGIDTFDLMVDLIADPDLSGYRWKDEDDYEHARRLGLIDDRVHRRVTEARQEVVGLIETRQGPFAHDWTPLPHETWPVPSLPEDAATGHLRDLPSGSAP